jgi:hypothetical protein
MRGEMMDKNERTIQAYREILEAMPKRELASEILKQTMEKLELETRCDSRSDELTNAKNEMHAARCILSAALGLNGGDLIELATHAREAIRASGKMPF